jgi:hypothetical protein
MTAMRKHMLRSGAILLALCFFQCHAFADAVIHEWIGRYAMNHDGWAGTLSISDSKQDCATSPWCHLVLQYTDSNGRRLSGTIASVDQKFQHMVFFINFPNGRQKFDGYLFSWDKTKMAGTTYWAGQTYGFFASKQ